MHAGMRGASADSLADLVAELTSALAAGGQGGRTGEELFAVSGLLGTEPALRRVLTDPSRSAEAKQGLVRGVLDGKISASTLDLVASAAGRRWAATRDLGDALEYLGAAAVVKAAEAAGEADALEDQLFSVSQLISTSSPLRDALADPARTVADKQGLLRGLLAGKVTAGTQALVDQAVAGSHRNVVVAIEEFQKVAAAQRDRLVALVRVARPLEADKEQRLAQALSAQYGRPVHLNTVVDPHVLGGVRVEIGDDVIDGTVASRLDDARRRLAG